MSDLESQSDSGSGTPSGTGSGAGSGSATADPPPNPADVYAAIQWIINGLHNKAVQAYWTNKANWPAIKACLEAAHTCLAPMTVPGTGGDSCMWPDCGDGKGCRPVCTM